MNKKSLITLGLIFGFSITPVLAEGSTENNNEYNNTIDRLTLAQRNSIGTRSDIANMILNTRNFLSKTDNNVKENPVRRNSSNSNKRESFNPKNPKIESIEPKRTITRKLNEKRRSGNHNPNDAFDNGKTVSKTAKRNEIRESRLSKQGARLYALLGNARNLDQLSKGEIRQIMKLHRQMLTKTDTRILLATIQKGEDGGPLVIVGKGQRKSKKFREIMCKLNFRTHPANQFPKGMRCFVHNKKLNRCSTASGNYQITKTNWDYYKKYLDLKDFSVESQQIIALELIRTGRARIVKGNYKGRGYVELMKGNLKNAIRYGTNDWASSPFSEWDGYKTNYLEDARQIAKNFKKQESEKLKDQAYFQSWLDDFEKDANL